jgi:hypothetical protein
VGAKPPQRTPKIHLCREQLSNKRGLTLQYSLRSIVRWGKEI